MHEKDLVENAREELGQKCRHVLVHFRPYLSPAFSTKAFSYIFDHIKLLYYISDRGQRLWTIGRSRNTISYTYYTASRSDRPPSPLVRFMTTFRNQSEIQQKSLVKNAREAFGRKYTRRAWSKMHEKSLVENAREELGRKYRHVLPHFRLYPSPVFSTILHFYLFDNTNLLF